jgi:nuclear pore complex protein Nup155
LDNSGHPASEDSLTTISSPDAYNQGVVILEDEVAIIPKVCGSLDKMLFLDASLYQDGTTVLAMNSGLANRGSGDVVIATVPDFLARKKSTSSNITTTSPLDHNFEVAGGLSETLFLPLRSTYSSTPADIAPTLNGGRVWCISQSCTPTSPVVALAFASQTPSDFELGGGLPPAYFPPSKTGLNLKTNASSSNNENTVTFRSVVPSRPNVGILLTKATIQAISNVLLSRPLRYGISMRLDQVTKKPAVLQQLYRISSRFGYNGFSATAGERANPSENIHNNLKSARLNPWLLRTPVVPLNSMAIQHLIPSRKMVAINAGGLHYFEFHSVLASLSDALMSACPGNGGDKYVANFFTSFGFKEGCAMCILLAIGYGPAVGGETHAPELQQRAIRAALARAFVPSLVRVEQQSGSNGATAYRRSALDSTVPIGYDFRPSFLSEGIDAVISRLLRPVWHKPAVVVTEGRTIKHGRTTRVTPAKVELLLDDSTLEEVRKPLFALQNLMKGTFSPAVAKVPGRLSKEENRMMDIDGVGENNFLTRVMSYRGHLRSNAADVVLNNGQLSPSDAESLARLIEEKNLHSLYRLLSRTVQLLSLFPLLRKAQSKTDLPEVAWGLLHGVTFAQLALSREGHERLEAVLNSLVTASPTSAGVADSSSADSDELAGQFADQCYLYFSPGSRFAYFGFRFAHDALLRCESTSTQRTVLSKKATECFKKAARHWFSPTLIVGGYFHNAESESSEHKALRAMQSDSPLAKATSLLIQLGDVVGVVDVCLITASNFGGKDLRDTSLGLAVGEEKSSSMLPWEHGLYHKRREAHEFIADRGPPSSAVVGAGVTATDAMETCHALVFHHLLTLLDSPNTDVALRMLSACVASYDTTFLHGLFSHLLRSNHTQILLKVQSDELEKWLKGEGVDPNLLFRYYVIQNQKYQAGDVMWKRATNANLDLPLADRVECLTRALDNFKAAREESLGATDATAFVRYDELDHLVMEVQERLDVAKLQLRVLSKIHSLGMELQAGQLKKLSLSLVDISDLYNDFAAPHQMFDICLLIFHACRNNEAPTIRKLWKTVVVQEILPCATRSEDAYRFLQILMEGSLLDETVTMLSENASAIESLRLFENGDWIPKVQDAVIGLGLEVFGNSADYVFPVDFIAVQLEGKDISQLDVIYPEVQP